ncbi:hypothetical protein [Marinoscillum furvescens]|uniref:Tetratricopeptide repeat protein n=1 Tax=Marinoscillum furvescens DSM 4134 TaxID=1122208 RepID=A0A3D9KX62_MARFU|nr:hypothetical protein [Marinoscillum furvescens]RED93363.1 hypothetical protein C7460_1258 [Marinoscillum furvescens DSM 4134]
MNIKLLQVLLPVLIFCASVNAQVSRDFAFLNHLSNLKEYREALHFGDQMLNSRISWSQRDSVNFLLGKYAYELKELDRSIGYFDAVSSRSTQLHTHAMLFGGFELAYQKKYANSKKHFLSVTPTDSALQELQVYELAGLALLERKFETFDKYSSRFRMADYRLVNFQEDMRGIAKDITGRRTKSPFLAGLMSAVVPGTGKFYTGHIGQGAMGLVGVGVLGLQAWEAYRKDGIESPRFIVFGSLFSVFYAANIWGSVVGVRVTEMRYNQDVDEAILVNMHLPIRLLLR